MVPSLRVQPADHGKEGMLVRVQDSWSATLHPQLGSRDGTQLAFSILFSPGSQHGVTLPRVGVSFPTSMNPV